MKLYGVYVYELLEYCNHAPQNEQHFHTCLQEPASQAKAVLRVAIFFLKKEDDF